MGQTSDTLVPRLSYMSVLEQTLESPAIKVLAGIRRCGKSTLLKMLSRDLLAKGLPEKNLLFMKMDSYDVPLVVDAQWLDAQLSFYVDEADPSFPFYVFLDEIQDVTGWERPVRRLHESGRARIYLTGSNAFLLSSDLATYLSGRYVEIEVYPLSFREFNEFSDHYEAGIDRTKGELFNLYLRYGGMPGLFAASAFSREAATRELGAIHDTVLLNDVAKRFGIRDIDLLEKLLRYAYTTAGNLFSANKVAGALTSMGRKTNSETVDNYLNALEKAFALYECQQVGLKGKAVLQPQKKYYAPDSGLRNLESDFRMQDIGFQFENIVYMELRRRSYDVNVGALPTGEIDFVAQKHSDRMYIQVCESILDETTRQREEAPLNAVGDSYPKLILTRDAAAEGTTDTGIRIRELSEWLLEGES